MRMSISVSILLNLVWQLQGKAMEPPSQETDGIKVYDVMRAEVRRAVAEACSELKKVIPG
jgi:hypothetical protein